jgi:hypothetical protein
MEFTVGIGCEIVPESFHKQIGETDFVTPISQTMQAIWKKIQNRLANDIPISRMLLLKLK